MRRRCATSSGLIRLITLVTAGLLTTGVFILILVAAVFLRWQALSPKATEPEARAEDGDWWRKIWMGVPDLIVDEGKVHVLVTGGAGYIGSHAAILLLELGHTVTVVDNLSRGNQGAIAALQAEARPDHFLFWEADIGDSRTMNMLLEGIDVVMHFAAVAYVAESAADPLLYHRNITYNTLVLLEAMKLNNVHRIVYSSTCATYGNAKTMPITEATPQLPISPYGHSKLAAEKIILDYQASSPLSSVAILRYFNVIGSDPKGRLGEFPRKELSHKYGRASGACFDVAMGKRPYFAIFGTDHATDDGTCVRDYVNVVDLVKAHVTVMQKLDEEDGDVLIYNVAVGKGYSVREFVVACAKATQRDIRVREAPSRDGDAAMVYADPHKINSELGFKPEYVDLAESLRTAWRWHAAHPDGYEHI